MDATWLIFLWTLARYYSVCNMSMHVYMLDQAAGNGMCKMGCRYR